MLKLLEPYKMEHYAEDERRTSYPVMIPNQ